MKKRTLRCLINGGMGEGGRRSFLNLINGGLEVGWGVVGILKYPLISVTDEKRRNLILMLNLEVSKQTSSEVLFS